MTTPDLDVTSRSFLKSRSVIVVDGMPGWWESLTKSAAFTRNGKSGYAANMLKMAAFSQLQYGAVVVVDHDMFLFDARWLPRALELAAAGAPSVLATMLTPANGGLFVVRPSGRSEEAVASALRHGFSREKGWGGRYHPEDAHLGAAASVRSCEEGSDPLTLSSGCCNESTLGGRAWCFNAADRDQGLLYHMVTDAGTIERRARWINAPSGEHVLGRSGRLLRVGEGYFHAAWAHPKPWEWGEEGARRARDESARRYAHSAREYARFWGRWPESLAPRLASASGPPSGPPSAERASSGPSSSRPGDAACAAFFEGSRSRAEREVGDLAELDARQPTRPRAEQHAEHEQAVHVPVLWVHVHKAAGSLLCNLARQYGERIISPSKTCNLEPGDGVQALGEAPDGMHCTQRFVLHQMQNATWAQLEREARAEDLACGQRSESPAFLTGIALRSPVALMQSVARHQHFNLTALVGWLRRAVGGSPVGACGAACGHDGWQNYEWQASPAPIAPPAIALPTRGEGRRPSTTPPTPHPHHHPSRPLAALRQPPSARPERLRGVAPPPRRGGGAPLGARKGGAGRDGCGAARRAARYGRRRQDAAVVWVVGLCASRPFLPSRPLLPPEACPPPSLLLPPRYGRGNTLLVAAVGGVLPVVNGHTNSTKGASTFVRGTAQGGQMKRLHETAGIDDQHSLRFLQRLNARDAELYAHAEAMAGVVM
jgi:hypothetical protein